MLGKEDILWKRDTENKFISEEVKIEIYDRNLDFELKTEAIKLGTLLKKQKITKDDEEKKVLNVDIVESRDMLKELNKIIDETKKVNKIKIIPCTIGEISNVQQDKTIDAKEIDDPIAHLIHKKCIEPKLTYEEAKDMKSDYRIAFKDAIMEHSGYKIQTYKDIINDSKISEKKKNI